MHRYDDDGIRHGLTDGKPFVLKAALGCGHRHGMLDREAERMTEDPTPIVGLHMLSLVAISSPEAAAGKVMGFLKKNPDELTAALLGCCPSASLAQRLAVVLQDPEQRRYFGR